MDTNELREGSDELSKSMLNENGGTDGTLDNEVNSQKNHSDPVNDCFDNESSVPIDKPIGVNTAQKSYVNIVKYDELPKILNYIPTLITDSGNEVVIFDEALVNKGSER
ncbi:hypothetical protein Tco_0263218 [Tanacetum coccineum]